MRDRNATSLVDAGQVPADCHVLWRVLSASGTYGPSPPALWTGDQRQRRLGAASPAFGGLMARVKVWAQGRDCGLEGRAQGTLLMHNMPGGCRGTGGKEAPVPFSPVTGGG